MKKNRWHLAICDHLSRVSEAQTADQILIAIEASGFVHASVRPRSTLGARLAELVYAGVVDHVGQFRRWRYQLAVTKQDSDHLADRADGASL